jgi:hypothetical protein
MTLEATSILAATAPANLPPLPPAFRSVVGTETCIWFNAFAGRVYRDASGSAHFRAWLLEKMTTQLNRNSKTRPGFLDDLQVVDVTFGATPPLLLNMTWAPKVTAEGTASAASASASSKDGKMTEKTSDKMSEKTVASSAAAAGGDKDKDEDEDDEDEDEDAPSPEGPHAYNEEDDEVAATCDFAFRSGLKFKIVTKVWVNWPRERYASIPVTLDLELVEISGRIKLGVRHSHSFVSFLEEPHTRFSVLSGLGSDSFKLNDIPTLSTFIVRKLESFISRRFVHPNGHKFR